MKLLRRFPVILALLAQMVAFAVVSQIASASLPAPAWLVIHGVLAAGIGALMGLPRWWLPFQVVAPSAMALASGLPPWVSLAVLAVLVLLYGGGVATRVPLYLSNRAAHRALADLLAGRDAPAACDLGAGFGGPMRHLAAVHPAGRFTSVEASPVTCLVAWLLALPRRNVRVRWGDLWRADLSGLDLVYAFLSPEPMPRLWERFLAEARPGTLLVSNTFAVPGIEPEKVIELPGRADARLLVYRHP